MKIKFLFFILSLISLIGCSKSKTDNNESKNEIYEPEINSSNKDCIGEMRGESLGCSTLFF